MFKKLFVINSILSNYVSLLIATTLKFNDPLQLTDTILECVKQMTYLQQFLWGIVNQKQTDTNNMFSSTEEGAQELSDAYNISQLRAHLADALPSTQCYLFKVPNVLVNSNS